MDRDFLWDLLLYSLVFNYAILLFWFFAFLLAKDALRGLHGKWFKLPPEQFDAIHYSLMGVYKIGIFLFNLAPLVAIWFVGRGGS